MGKWKAPRLVKFGSGAAGAACAGSCRFGYGATDGTCIVGSRANICSAGGAAAATLCRGGTANRNSCPGGAGYRTCS